MIGKSIRWAWSDVDMDITMEDEKTSMSNCPGDVIRIIYQLKMTQINSRRGKIVVKHDQTKKGVNLSSANPLINMVELARIELAAS
jgi:hypothetical protein